MIGSEVSHYRITEKLGEGGMGVVYKAEDMRLQRTVALKFLSPSSLSEDDRVRFVREAQAAARVHHPNICPVYEISEHEGRLFFAMAFMEGRTIAHLLRQGPLSVDTALDIAIQIAAGLQAAHRSDVVHRDIKSTNITVDSNGNAAILDFGIALRQDTERLTAPGGTVGTPAYMSPEQAQGLKVDRRTDLWSLGVVLFEMLTGQLPFRRDSQFSVLYAIVKEQPQPVSLLRPEVSAQLGAFLVKALAKDPAKRWQSAGEMGVELRRIRESRSQGTRTLTMFTNQMVRSRAWKVWAVAVVAVAVIVAGYFTVRKIWPPLPEMKQVAVLPLTVDAGNAALRVLADGVVESLTSKLTQVEEFQGKITVVPASEIRGRNITTASDARRLYNANLAITGYGQSSGGHTHFDLNLVDTAPPVHQINTASFDLDTANPIAARDQAVERVVGLLALKLSPDTTTALVAGETKSPGAYADYLRGIGYLARYDIHGNIDRAVESLTKATSQDSGYALAFAALGDAYWRQATITSDKSLVERALDNIHRAIQISPSLPAAHLRLAEIYRQNGRFDDAIHEAKFALRIAPRNAEVYRALGGAYSSATRYKEAENAYLEAVRYNPSNWNAHLSLGFFYWQRGLDEKARASYLAALNLTPDNEIVFRDLAALALREGKYREASDMLNKSVKFDRQPRTYSTLGIAYYYQRKYAEASRALETSIDLNPEFYVAWGNLGTVYRHMPGSESKARSAFDKAISLAQKGLRITPADYAAHANLAEYFAKSGQPQRALDEINGIPDAVRPSMADPIVVAFEFSGHRNSAIALIRSLTPTDPSIRYMKDDPDLELLWMDPALSR